MKLNLIVLVAALVGSTFALPSTQKIKQTPLGIPYQGKIAHCWRFDGEFLLIISTQEMLFRSTKRSSQPKRYPFNHILQVHVLSHTHTLIS
ncbi:hypothetical protein FB192DRAFT_1050042 [Mucor lusitanicus]|uniref:Uncharacterized protein n=1 Tax=Mucor circinelloides f. lusitanicus TaxID=29924 RepID=A0A8H4BNF2_MUCCL|nr:hypothetical protein FB192DRAFT_1050042 [Mucor lusitanicus]